VAARRHHHPLVSVLVDDRCTSVVTRPEGRSRGRLSAARLLLFLGGLAGCASAIPGPPESAAVALAPAVYTAEQATRGEQVFTTICSTCHGRNEFTGPIFALTWRAEPVGSLFEHISLTMPQDDPGSLSADQYAAIVAYLLQLNGRPAGDRELPANAGLLDGMRW
jgi:mono/diheme cytochrome c family protein